MKQDTLYNLKAMEQISRFDETPHAVQEMASAAVSIAKELMVNCTNGLRHFDAAYFSTNVLDYIRQYGQRQKFCGIQGMWGLGITAGFSGGGSRPFGEKQIASMLKICESLYLEIQLNASSSHHLMFTFFVPKNTIICNNVWDSI